MSRRALCTVGLGRHVELLDLTVPAWERYALRHDYDLVVRTEVSGLGERPPSWAKVVVLRELLDRYDQVVWVDADAAIVDPSDDIGREATRRPISLVAHDVDGDLVPNCGVMVLRRGRTTFRLLERVWQRTDLVHHRWWENAALIAEVGGDPERGLVTRSSRVRAARYLGALDLRWNSVPPCPSPRPAIEHLAGCSHDERIRRLGELARAAREPDPAV